MSRIARPGAIRPWVLVIACCCIFQQATGNRVAASAIDVAVERAFRPLLAAYDVPGMAVAVTVEGRQYYFSYGVASKATNTPVTKDTLFEVGSVSKTLTATLVAYAEAIGALSLNDHPGKYIPLLRNTPIDDATLLHLGTYTAGGLPLQFPDLVTNDADAFAYFRRWKPSAAPAAQRRYSNPSIGLLGRVAAVAMKSEFKDLVEGTLFRQLDLRHSYIRVPDAAMENYAWGYDKETNPIRVNPGVFDAEAYGVKSTAADMIRFVEANLRPEALPLPMRRAVERTHVGYFKVDEMVQDLGWEQYGYPVPLDRLLAGNSSSMTQEANPSTALHPPQKRRAPTLFNKTGSTNGFGAYVAFVSEPRIGIVMLANKNFPNAARVTAAHAVLAHLSSSVRSR